MYSSLEFKIFSILSKKKNNLLIYVFILVFSND